MKNKLKKFISESDDIKEPIYFRPGTLDEHIIDRLIVKRDEYKFPMLEPKLVFDIGANIGVAAILLSQIYPKAQIHCFEPEPENFEILRLNTEHLGSRVVLNKVALSNHNGTAMLQGSDDPKNHGGFSMHILKEDSKFAQQQIPVVRTSFYMAKVGIPEVIKIDCEGAEHDILLDVPDLSKVLWIAGELHNVKDHELLAHLTAKGFDIESRRNFGEANWPFHAANKSRFFVKDAVQS